MVSTPKSKDLRRISIMNASATFSGKTPGRRSLMTPQTVVAELQNSRTDDEAERNHRRNTVSMHRRLSSLAAANASPLTEINQITNEAELKDHLKICTKLFTENKISTKNAWELHIIDIIRKITSTESANVLQVAGSSLDIGAKVYALRVDDVHTRGLKLASTMSRTSENQHQENIEGDDGPAEEADGRRKTAPKKKKKGLRGDKKNTIDKEGKTLSSPLKELESVLFSTKDNIEISATDNLFTHKLHLNPATHQFMLMSLEKHWVTGPDVQLEEDDVVQIDLVNITGAPICQAFKDFDFGDWSPNEEDKQLINASIDPQDVVLDDNGVPIPELDGSLPNIFDVFNEGGGGGEDPDTDVEEHGEFQAQIHGEIAHIVDTIPEEERIKTDYGFNALIRTTSGKFFDKIWAGPFHWKVKFNRRSSSRFSGKTVQVAKHTRRIKIQQPVDLTVVPDIKDVKKYVVKRTRATMPSEKITLPVPEISYEIYHENTEGLLSKPGVKYTNRAPQEAQVCEVASYNYENPNDSQYCSQHNTDDGLDGEPIHNSFEEEPPPAALQNLMGENLVDAPETVAATQMAYALHAKKMDMKKLKSAIWKRLTEGRENQSKVTVTPLQFSQLYKDIPNYISDDMKKELSCPLAFVALLHLCNENELLLEQNANCKDFTVTKAKKCKV